MLLTNLFMLSNECKGKYVRLLSLIIFEINMEIQLAVLNGRVCHHTKGGGKMIMQTRPRCVGQDNCVVSCSVTYLTVIGQIWTRACDDYDYDDADTECIVQILNAFLFKNPNPRGAQLLLLLELLLKIEINFHQKLRRNFISQRERGAGQISPYPSSIPPFMPIPRPHCISTALGPRGRKFPWQQPH